MARKLPGAFALAFAAAACASAERTTFDLNSGPSSDYAYPLERKARALVVLAEKPQRPFTDMGPIEVSCPLEATTTSERDLFNPRKATGKVEVTGGCTFSDAIGFARRRAAEMGADGMYAVHTSAGDNGRIVLLLATAFRYSGAAPVASSAPPASSAAPPPRPSVEERLQHLKELREKGLITPEDYERRKAEILKEL